MARWPILHGDPPRRRRFDEKSLAELAVLSWRPGRAVRQKLRVAGHRRPWLRNMRPSPPTPRRSRWASGSTTAP
ncbi:MAG: hypothetical protein IPM94_15205 [bacterium]|nr:hypothetical protein [bacterium]